MNDLIKATRCLASNDPEGNCYMDYHNAMNRSEYMSCSGVGGKTKCPYYQDTYDVCFEDGDCMEWLEEVANKLEELEIYRKIGTAEECRAAVEKHKAKKANLYGDGYADGKLVYDTYKCPNCGKEYEIDYEEYAYCPECGQRMELDWSEEDENEK